MPCACLSSVLIHHVFTVLSPLPRAHCAELDVRWPCLSALEGRREEASVGSQQWGVGGAATSVQALWGADWISVPLSPVGGTFHLHFKSRTGGSCLPRATCPAQGHIPVSWGLNSGC